MISYLVIFFCCLFLMKLPFFILGLLLRFAKPLALIGFGCFAGVTLTTGIPDSGHLTQSQVTPPNSSSGVDFSDLDEFVSPALIEAALSSASDFSESLRDFADKIQSGWADNTQKKITVARNSSGSDFRGIDRSLRKR